MSDTEAPIPPMIVHYTIAANISRSIGASPDSQDHRKFDLDHPIKLIFDIPNELPFSSIVDAYSEGPWVPPPRLANESRTLYEVSFSSKASMSQFLDHASRAVKQHGAQFPEGSGMFSIFQRADSICQARDNVLALERPRGPAIR